MQRRFFLTGPAGSGKSRLIREALGEGLAGAGGFMTGPVIGPEGYAVGYALRPAAAAAGVEGLACPVFLDCRVWPPKQDTEVFRGDGVRLLQEAMYYPCAVLDELGGFEMLIPQFRQALDELLRSGVPLLGALKTEAETEQWRQLFGLGEKLPAFAAELRLALQRDPETMILDLEKVEESRVLAALAEWVAAYT